MSIVYVVQEPLKKTKDGVKPRIDLTPAESFGQLVYLLGWSDTRNLSREQITWKLRGGLRSYGDADYILPLGSPSVMGLAISIAAENNDGRVRSLEWDNVTGGYRVVSDDLNCQPL